MNTGRFVGASVAVFIVRTLLNFLFYGFAISGQYQAMTAEHPGIFREVLPAYIVLDLVSALLFVYLFAKAGSAFGGGVKGGVSLGLLVALLSPVLGALYWFFSLTVYPVNLLSIELVYQLVAYAIQGAVAGAVYKTA